MKRARMRGVLWLGLAGALAAGVGCGGGSSSSSTTTGGGGNAGGGGGTTNNVQAIVVNTGPTGNYIDGAFTTVTVCVPGSITNCQTISGVLVDTGSSGLRILSSALMLTLPQQMGTGGAPIVECLPFVDGFTWGPVQMADMTIAGEKASSMAIQVIGSASFPTIPASCSSNGSEEDDLASLGVNGILGVGNFAQDCGEACVVNGGANAGFYYVCPAGGCAITTEALADQVVNPVVLFAKDNNGVILELPAVTGAETGITGSLIFGIGTQSNNGLGSATVYGIDPNTGNFTTTYKGVTYSDQSFLDSGSNAIYFLDTATTGFQTCADLTFWYCPAATQNLSAMNQGANGASGTVQFVVGNADTLTANASDGVANGLAGPNTGMFDWGLPFFFGRNVYTAIEGQNTPGGAGPYWAY
jgi:hypothetical protein